jgi:NADPH-dependent 2,4-dienoyl-CoA reductase/sulfur reductase-like enzyme
MLSFIPFNNYTVMNTKTQNRQFVVIGGVAAGMSAASAVKRDDPTIHVIVLEKGEFISYGSCSLPYYISGIIKDYRQLIVFTPEQAKQERDIDVWTKHEAMAIYPAKQTVSVLDRDTGKEKTLEYDSLMIATGGTPISPPIPGIDLPNVFQVRTLTDGRKIKRYIVDHAPKKAVIIGGGYIGLEMAECCKTLGMEVTILEKLGNIMGMMGTEITELIEQELKDQGIQLVKEIHIDSFEVVDGECQYVLADGGKQRFDTDVVIVAIGVHPEVALAKRAGIEIGETGAISVNRNLQTNIDNIYAGGDCTEVTHLVSGEKAYIPLGTTANKQGRIVGRNIVNPECCQFRGVVGTAVTKVCDLEIARTGLSLMEAKRLGFEAITSTITTHSRAGAYPGNQNITITLILDKTSKRVLGAEMAGKEGVAKRIDILATALHNQMTVHALTQLDLSYAPPFAPVWDPVLVAANVGVKKVS